jgi:hypothetical protein
MLSNCPIGSTLFKKYKEKKQKSDQQIFFKTIKRSVGHPYN